MSAIAVIARFPDDEGSTALEAYRQGQGVDPLAGAEAVISPLGRTYLLKIPCAHAPALAPIALDPTISPRSAAEELGHTFLPCVLAGLSRAPQFVEVRADSVMDSSVIKAEQVDAVIVPATAFGGSAVMSLAQARRLTSSSGPQIGPQIISVGENSTTMAVSASALGIPAIRSQYLPRSRWPNCGLTERGWHLLPCAPE